MQLTNAIQDKATRDAIAADCTQLIDRQVSAKGGLGGMALKAAYGVVKGIGSDYIPGAVNRLLPETCAALDPMWAEGVEKGAPVAHLSSNCDRTADLVLSATDARIARANKGVISATYSKLRKSIKSDVVAAVPGLAEVLGKHVS
ncbi:MAG: hypothetical protein AAFS06_09595 [Cyanobacteria bacterium J06631_12]